MARGKCKFQQLAQLPFSLARLGQLHLIINSLFLSRSSTQLQGKEELKISVWAEFALVLEEMSSQVLQEWAGGDNTADARGVTGNCAQFSPFCSSRS